MIANKIALALCAVPVLLVTSPASAAVPAVLKDNVTCIYDAVTDEQREIVQTLLLENLQNGGGPFGDNANAKEIQATFKDAMDACVDKYSWSSGKTEGGMGYATLTMLTEVIGPLVEKDGVVLADIDGYIAARKAGWRLSGPPTKAMHAEFLAYLSQKGWHLDNERIKQGAEFYFTLQVGREASRRMFAQNVTYRH